LVLPLNSADAQEPALKPEGMRAISLYPNAKPRQRKLMSSVSYATLLDVALVRQWQTFSTVRDVLIMKPDCCLVTLLPPPQL